MQDQIERVSPPPSIRLALGDGPSGPGSACFFLVEDRVLSATTMEAKFPGVDQVLKRREGHADVEVGTEPLMASARRCKMAATNSVKIDALDNKLVLLGESERGRIEEVLEVEYNHPARAVRLSLNYVMQFVETCEAEKLVMSIDSNDMAGVLFRPAMEADETHVCCIMPCKM